jgi:hypothetical protein
VPNRVKRRRASIEREILLIRTWSDLDKYLPCADEGDDDVFRERHDEDSDSEDEIVTRLHNYQDAR